MTDPSAPPVARVQRLSEHVGRTVRVQGWLTVLTEEGVKITISLSRRSVEFFKEAAERNNTSYQRMIRRLLDAYADQHRAAPAKRSSGRSTGSRR
jgi:predicted DNA binding CopG/RHH family protein